MAKKRIVRRLYFHERYYRIEHDLYKEENDDETLFSGRYKTKIQAEDLPDWYVYGRYYKRFGYISTKGITDMVYIPNLWINHFLKDDFLLIAYSGKIELIDDRRELLICEKYVGYDETVCGNEIMDVMKGARQYSDFDITSLIQQIKDKKAILQKKHPEEFGPDVWNFDVDAYFEKPLEKYRYTTPVWLKKLRKKENDGE
ncbi:MAG: hypothetical protein PHX51_02510 [Clostridia bacterium]|nr:hypothetical protein [Clostridia bacterium]